MIRLLHRFVTSLVTFSLLLGHLGFPAQAASIPLGPVNTCFGSTGLASEAISARFVPILSEGRQIRMLGLQATASATALKTLSYAGALGTFIVGGAFILWIVRHPVESVIITTVLAMVLGMQTNPRDETPRLLYRQLFSSSLPMDFPGFFKVFGHRELGVQFSGHIEPVHQLRKVPQHLTIPKPVTARRILKALKTNSLNIQPLIPQTGPLVMEVLKRGNDLIVQIFAFRKVDEWIHLHIARNLASLEDEVNFMALKRDLFQAGIFLGFEKRDEGRQTALTLLIPDYRTQMQAWLARNRDSVLADGGQFQLAMIWAILEDKNMAIIDFAQVVQSWVFNHRPINPHANSRVEIPGRILYHIKRLINLSPTLGMDVLELLVASNGLLKEIGDQITRDILESTIPPAKRTMVSLRRALQEDPDIFLNTPLPLVDRSVFVSA